MMPPVSREFPKNIPPKIALPTVGRIVHVFHPHSVYQQLAGIVAHVAEYDTLKINVTVCNHDGTTGPLQGLKHASLPRNAGEPYWDWMEFQKGQAAKTEELEAKLKHQFGEGATFSSTSEIRKQQADVPSPIDGKQ